MNNTISFYRLTNKQMPGYIYLVYENGTLREIKNELREPIESWESVIAAVPQFETLIRILLTPTGNINIPFKVEEMPQKTIEQKVVAFCAHYMHFRHVSYKASKIETANLKNVQVTDALLTAFFTCEAWFVQNNYTISNYIKRINLLKDFVKNGPSSKSKFPDKYDAEFEKKLEAAAMQEYWAHLRGLGFTKLKRGTASVWVEKGVTV